MWSQSNGFESKNWHPLSVQGDGGFSYDFQWRCLLQFSSLSVSSTYRGFYGGKYLDSPFLGFVLGLIFSEERFKFVVTLFSPNLLVNINIEKGKK